MTAAPSVASSRSASGGTFDGPQPNRPSAGSRSAGIWMVIRGVPLATVAPLRPPAGPRRELASGGAAGGPSSGGRDRGDRLHLDRVEALDLFGLARLRPD